MNSPSANQTAPKPDGQATPGQLLAASPERSVWVSANAGTGKTRVLVDRIARMLLGGTDPQKILCLTFTKTAAAEMTARINKRLGHWVMMDDVKLVSDIAHLIDHKPNEETVALARKLFARVLETPGGLKIRTIHSFCESLLARFPLEAGVAPHFSVIDERTTSELMIDARNRVLEHAFDQGGSDVALAMRALAEQVNEEDFQKLMRELLGSRGNLDRVVDFYKDGVIDAIADMAGLDADCDTVERVCEAASAEGVFDELGLTRAAVALSHGATTSKEKSLALSAWLKSKPDVRAKTLESEYLGIFLKKDGDAKAAKTLITNDARKFDDGAEDTLLAEQARMVDVLDQIRSAKTVAATRALVTVGMAIKDQYETLKRAHAGLDYDDLIEKAKGLLNGESASGWVHFKLDGGIDHILVDESQDTSPSQWRVVQGLSEDFFSGFGQHEEKVRTVFAVGDEKQSIYSFQGADPYEFGRMHKWFEARVLDAGGKFSGLSLTLSFRSTRPVLAIVDRVFKNPVAFDGLSFDDEEVLHQSHRLGEAGLVELWPPTLPEEAAEADPWDAPLDRLSLKSPATRLAERIAMTIRRWFDNGEMLQSKGRPIRADDILILVRKRGAFAEEMVRQLKLNAIEVAGSDRMVLTDQIAVEDLMALGRFCLLAEDDLNLAALLKSPLVGLSEDALMKLAPKRKASLWAALSQAAKTDATFKQAHQTLKRYRAKADFQPPYEFFAAVLTGGGRQQLVARLGSDCEDPIDEFLSLAMDFERTHTPSLEGFLHWVESGATQIKRDMEFSGPKVRVMTVHGAKGLEANVVFLPDTCSKPDHRTDDKIQWRIDAEAKHAPVVLWSPVKEMRPKRVGQMLDDARTIREREYRRLLYVAMTRARDRLYLAGFAGEKGPAEGSWYELIKDAVMERGEEIEAPFGTDGESLWRYQSAQEHEPKTEIVRDETVAATLPDWAQKPPQAEVMPPSPLSPSSAARAGADDATPEPVAQSPFAGGDTRRFKRGLLIHKLLELLVSLPVDLRSDAARQWLAQPALELGNDSARQIATETLAVLQAPEFAPLFDINGHSEAPIVGVALGRVVSGRIDRLVINDDEVLIIDYKTNRPPPLDVADVAPAYLSQMAIYRVLLGQIYPTRAIRCFLLWTDGPRAMELTPEVLEPFSISPPALDGGRGRH